jgi:hypothetical protein
MTITALKPAGIQIDKGVPVPEPKGPRARYPLKYMEVGDSFFVPDTAAKINPVRRAASWATKTYAPKRFTARTVTESGIRGVRVWRFA